MTEPLTLTVLIVPREGVFLAQTVEHSYCATGSTKDEALDNLCEVLRGQAELDREAGRVPLTWMPAARAMRYQLPDAARVGMPERILDLFPEPSGGAGARQQLRLAPVG